MHSDQSCCFEDSLLEIKFTMSEMERTIPRIMSMLNGAAEGQPARLQEMGLGEGFTYDMPEKFNPEKTSKQDLLEEISDLIFCAEAAR